MSTQRVLILSFSFIHRDPRVLRQISWLKEHYDITVAGYSAPIEESCPFIQIDFPNTSLFAKFIKTCKKIIFSTERYFWSQKEVRQTISLFSNSEFDLIICNDIETLPIGVRLKKGAKILFDAHEFAPLHFEHSLYWRIFYKKLNTELCKKYIPLTDAMITVSPGLARGYFELTGVKPIVITNAPKYHGDLEPRPLDDKIKIIHHGAAKKTRNIEEMIHVAKYLDDRFELYFMLLPSFGKYFKKLKDLSAGQKNIFFLDPVKTREITAFIHNFDIGLFLAPPITFNMRHTLPNKLFEFIQARLMVVIGPSPDMAEVIAKYGNGIVAEDFSPQKTAKCLNLLTPKEIMKYKTASHGAALQESADTNAQIFLSIVSNLLKTSVLNEPT